MNKRLITIIAAMALTAGHLLAQGPLGDPTIVASTPAYSVEWPVADVFDDSLATDYASLNGGTDTFIDFDYGTTALITQFTFTDRRSSGSGNGSQALGSSDDVTSFDLIFSQSPFDPNDPNDTGAPNSVTVHVSSPGCCDTVVTPIRSGSGIAARYVRFKVTGALSATANTGAAEMNFVAYEAQNVPAIDPRGLALLALALALAGAFVARRS